MSGEKYEVRSTKYEVRREPRPARVHQILATLGYGDAIGHEVIVPVTKGRLDFGPWQRVFYGEWDGQRKKRVLLKAMGE